MSKPEHQNLSKKTGLVLNVVLVVFFLFSLRIWQLALIEHDEKLQESRLAGKRIELEKATRGSIRDRFNEPLAVNKLRYQAAIVYADFKKIPLSRWEKDEMGKKKKVYPRKAYIKSLAELLAEELKLDSERVEDEIHAKAALLYNIPYTLKDSLTEKEYARLKMLARSHPGLVAVRTYSRIYPNNKLASDVIGYLGSINREDYQEILQEREELRLFLDGLENGGDLPLPEGFESLGAVKKRVKELEELAYTGSDSVGKTGIEAQFEEELRGLQGKKTVVKDSQGHIIKSYPGARALTPGKRLLLTLSKDLQEHAEKLLALTETTRDTRVKVGSAPTKKADKQPWIMGGAIVAMDPNTSEVLALATYPRSNPNDFNQKNEVNIHRWLEDEAYIANIWDGFTPLERERYDKKKDSYYDESLPLTWESYLDFILSKNSAVKERLLTELNTLRKGVKALQDPKEDPVVLDLLHLALDERLFNNNLLKHTGHFSIRDHRLHEQDFNRLLKGIEEILTTTFNETEFKAWRLENESAFIKEMRQQEKAEKKYPRPYLDYLDKEERRQFLAIWERNKIPFALTFLTGRGVNSPYTQALFEWRREIEAGAHQEIEWTSAFTRLKKVIHALPDDQKEAYLATLRSYNDLERPLKHKWKIAGKRNKKLKERDLAAAFHPSYGWGHSRSHAFRQATIQGSIFKLVTAYAALLEKEHSGASLPEIEDLYFKHGNEYFVGYQENKKPIPQHYKGGRIPRSHSSKIGKVDLLTAIELSSNPYFSLLASDVIKNPNDLLEAARKFSFGSKTGIDLPYELPGKLPNDLDKNPTGLFATAIGQHTLIVTPLQTAVQLATLANGGNRYKPEIISLKAGKKSGPFYEEIPPLSDYPLKEGHYLAGIDFPLATLPPSQTSPLIQKSLPELKEKIPLPPSVKDPLLEGMRRVVKRQSKNAIFSFSRIYKDYPELISDFVDLKGYLIGKTSTSEVVERLDLDKPDEIPIYTHVWFGAISYEEPTKPFKFEKPELVVVVYLRYGSFGNEAIPIASEIVKKWREIKKL